MYIMGIDYGRKRVGVALSDPGRMIAVPEIIFPNDKTLISKLSNIVRRRGVDTIVVGKPAQNTNLKESKKLLEEIEKFSEALSSATGTPIVFEDETLSSFEAARSSFSVTGKIAPLDSSAAAIILQRFLDKNRGN